MTPVVGSGDPAAGRSARPKALVVLLAVSILCLVATGYTLWHRSRTITETTLVRTVGQPALIDPRDCHSTSVCRVSAAAPDIVDAVRRHFPGSTRLDDFALIGDTGNRDRTSVRVRTTAGVVVSFASQCVQNGTPVPADQVSAGRGGPPRHRLSTVAARFGGKASGTELVGAVPRRGPAQVALVQPGSPGCSVAVVLDVPAGVAVPLSGAAALTREPSVQTLPY